jgi:D-alanine-D-alanine ligase
LLGEPGERSIRAIESTPQQSGLSLRDIATVDVIFPVLHGPYGEDGTIQGLLELADIPYVGAGVLGSSVGMDKALFKSVMRANDIPILPYQLILRSDWDQDPNAVMVRIESTLTYPVFVKPANLGSSVGIHKATDSMSLHKALTDAGCYDRRLLIEQGIPAREIEVSILGNDDPIASIPGEVIPSDEFYSYADKYIHDAAQLVIPAELTPEQIAEIQRVAITAFTAIDCAGLARADFFVDKNTGKVWMNEVNTIPGFTSISMYPKLWEASGLSYPDLIDRLIQLALERHSDKRRNKTSYEPEAQ